jgi:hypothetical protein
MTWLALVVLAQVDGGVVEDVVAVPAAEEAPADEGPDGFTPDEAQAQEVVRFTGYLDVGFAKATGNGSSFLANDSRVPLDYGNDAFAPMVNSRGDVASTDTQGRFTNGFLPRSVGIGSRPSFLINTASVDVRIQPRGVPLFVFVRAQLMPRLLPTGDVTRLDLQQAFGRYSPFKAHELAFFLGRFDSVFGIEYLENEANLRLGITPSLTARYTTGQGLGAKVFYRVQVPGLWSAFSLNASATSNGTRIEALVPVFASLTGAVVGAGRLGYELNLQKVQAKLGFSALYGNRSDVPLGLGTQWALAGDVRLNAFGFSLAAELTHLEDSRTATTIDVATPKQTGLGPAELASGFVVTGGWVRLGYTLPWTTSVLSAATLYARYDRREGRFVDFTQLKTARWTFGARVDLWDFLALKAEYLTNRELAGAPLVDNDVFTSSAVFTW